MSGSNPMPVAFVSDFGPMPAVDADDFTEALARLGDTLPRPRAVVVMSGHWETRGPLAVTGTANPAIIYDYHGFPPHFYDVRYPLRGDSATAAQVVALLTTAGITASIDPQRGIDHGAWVPLSRVYPRADVPIVQLTVPRANPRYIAAVGRALAPLRRDGVLLVAAGTLIHNLRLVHFQGKFDPPDAWATEFDEWLEARLNDVSQHKDELEAYRRLAPRPDLAAPTPEHFDPLFFALGAAEAGTIHHHYRAIRYGNGLLRIFSIHDG